MMETNFPLVGSFNKQRFAQFDPQRTVNMYVVADSDGKKPTALYPTQGRKKLFSLSAGSNSRSMFAFKEFLYIVCGQNIYKTDTAYNATRLTSHTSLNTSSGHVGMAANQNNQIIFVDGNAGYIFNSATSVFTKIADVNFPAFPTDVIYLDGFFIVNSKDTPEFHISKLNDGLTWTPLKLASLTVSPDVILGFETLRRQLFIYGRSCTEIWENQGFGDFPFRRIATLEYGIASIQTAAEGYERLIWLAKNPDGNLSVVMTNGTTPTPISTREIEEKINGFSKSDDAIAYIFKEKGIIFYKLTFPSENQTLLYCLNTQQWSEIEELGEKRDASQCHAYFNNKHLVGLYNNNNIYELSSNYPDNDGEAIRRLRITKVINDANNHRLRINKIEIDVVGGQATVTGNDANPVIFLGMSFDGGVTFPLYLKTPLPKVGEFTKRVLFRRLGTARAIVFKIEHFNKNQLAVLGGTMTYEVLPR